jgi:hypothetical protein
VDEDAFCTLQLYQGLQEEELVSDRNSYIVMEGRWCNTVLSVPVQRENGNKRQF